MTDKMREEFEAAAEQHFMLKERYLYWDEGEEGYEDPDVQLAYEFFVLSREAVEIELPEVKDLEIVGIGCTYEDSFVDYLEVVRAIEDTGLKVKPC